MTALVASVPVVVSAVVASSTTPGFVAEAVSAAMVIDPAPFVTSIPLPAVRVALASVLPVVFPMRSWPLV